MLLLTGSLLSFCSLTAQNSYTNPVIAGDLADPTVIRIGEYYYATATSSEWAPHYPMFRSDDLVNWKQIGHIFDNKPTWTLSSFWAPELYYHNGKLFAYYTARNQQGVSYIGVATADSPESPFTDHGVIVEYGTEAIDAFILEDAGKLYISWKAYGLDNRPIELLGCQLSDDGLRLEGEPFTLLRDDEGIGMEGQHWMKEGDYYYMIYSPKSCCGPGSDYQVYVARSRHLKGPYQKDADNPILQGGGDVLSCGHGTLTTTPDGRMYYLFHGYLKEAAFYGGRQVMLQEMIFDEQQRLRFKSGNIVQLEQPMPFEGTTQQPKQDIHDRFDSPQLPLYWTWNYPFNEVTVKTGNGSLQLSGTPKGKTHNGAALCLRPTSPNYLYETQLTTSGEGISGLTMYGDNDNLLIFGCRNQQLYLIAIRDGKEESVWTQPIATDSPTLRIEVNDGCLCSFYYLNEEQQWIQPDGVALKKDFSYLVRWDRVARPGLYHQGEGDSSGSFSFFKLTNR
ncbi:family 43 glycosylhydrolase [Parabacteroides sp. OttesenSCG-928-N08]|nr:family 43 glycosylhydrolase [Parabacteroides sp. OttesenSCG-928-N08]